jgi:2-amino-4-hydroxy-6-hydroxymethyldihydropteridine diphosphokinase
MTIISLALGTNLGDRFANLLAAFVALPPAVHILVQSPVYETTPWGLANQPTFLNMVLKGETELAPIPLLTYLKNLETKLGRQPAVRWGARLIDIDILFYGELVYTTPELTIPHPHLHERAFVLVPLADLEPDFIHPVLGKSISSLLTGMDTTGVKRYEPRA